MAYDIAKVNADLESILHGTTTNQITNLFGLYDRAARQLLLDCDPQETKRIAPFVTPIYNSVFDYASPTDLKGNKIIDIFPQVDRTSQDIWSQQYEQAFDVDKLLSLQDTFQVQFNSSLKTIRVNAPNQLPPIPITLANTSTGWSVGGNASNLQVDNVNFVAGGGSLSFDLSAGAPGSTGYLENSTLESQDLSNFVNQASNFLYTYLPTGSVFTSVQLRFGSSATDYYVLSATTTQQNTVFQNGWNLLAYVWSSMTTVGSPDATDITYVRVTWTYDGTAQTAVRLNDVVSIMGSILNIAYYSKYMFRDAVTGAYQETVTDNTNLINLDTDSYNLFLWLVAYFAAQQQQGANSNFDANYFLQAYKEALGNYTTQYKSETQKPQSVYYRQPNPSYTQWYGWGRWGY